MVDKSQSLLRHPPDDKSLTYTHPDQIVVANMTDMMTLAISGSLRLPSVL